MVLFTFPVTRVWAVDMEQVGIVPSQTPAMQDKSEENACDCCQKCKAAKRAINGEQLTKATAEKVFGWKNVHKHNAVWGNRR